MYSAWKIFPNIVLAVDMVVEPTLLGRSKPNLLRQETRSVRTALNILYRLYDDVGKTSVQQKTKVKMKLLRFAYYCLILL